MIVPQFLGRVEFIEQLEAAALRVGAQFVELALMATRSEVTVWLDERSRSPRDQTHIDAVRLLERSGHRDPVSEMYDAFLRAITSRPRTIRVEVIRGDIDATYQRLAHVLDNTPE